ncbi:ribonuclease H-like domain-containing protein [Tanacetum coccineum]|uniref:Ribonuclease H-like domain-containing protein n=1 Tax=Tanacetum coccineum TaxID=301880 RepID=A0ABQ5DUE2_9ASTR
MFVHNSEHNSPFNSDQDDGVHDPITRISKLDISDPLHLHPSDTTGLTVVSIKLKGTESYQVWSCVMLLALEGKIKIGFIDGSCKRSNTDEVLSKQWDRVNAIVLGWILNSISEELFLVCMRLNAIQVINLYQLLSDTSRASNNSVHEEIMR